MTSTYHPSTRQIHHAAGASLYARFHELAHAEQHERMTWLFIIWALGHKIPGVRHVVTVLIELDAHRRARVVMQRLGVWTPEAETEGRLSLRSYLKRQPRVPTLGHALLDFQRVTGQKSAK